MTLYDVCFWLLQHTSSMISYHSLYMQIPIVLQRYYNSFIVIIVTRIQWRYYNRKACALEQQLARLDPACKLSELYSSGS